jgi:hypothetical protein
MLWILMQFLKIICLNYSDSSEVIILKSTQNRELIAFAVYILKEIKSSFLDRR